MTREEALTIPAFFFGVAPGSSAGHYQYTLPGFRSADMRKIPASPWGIPGRCHLDEVRAVRVFDPDWTYPNRAAVQENQPHYQTLGSAGWTLLLYADRSGDKRGGSYSIFTFQRALALVDAIFVARTQAPAVFTRMDEFYGNTDLANSLRTEIAQETALLGVDKLRGVLKAARGY